MATTSITNSSWLNSKHNSGEVLNIMEGLVSPAAKNNRCAMEFKAANELGILSE
jgi:hypothetical protein